jgi:hypothetical protein
VEDCEEEAVEAREEEREEEREARDARDDAGRKVAYCCSPFSADEVADP